MPVRVENHLLPETHEDLKDFMEDLNKTNEALDAERDARHRQSFPPPPISTVIEPPEETPP